KQPDGSKTDRGQGKACAPSAELAKGPAGRKPELRQQFDDAHGWARRGSRPFGDREAGRSPSDRSVLGPPLTNLLSGRLMSIRFFQPRLPADKPNRRISSPNDVTTRNPRSAWGRT